MGTSSVLLQVRQVALVAAVAVAGFGFGVAGCGDDEAGNETSGGQPPTEGSTAPAERSPGAAPTEEFGAEATGRRRARIVAAFDAYMGALAAGDYATACRHLIPQVRTQLERAGSKREGGGCRRALSAFRGLARRSAGREVEQVRVEDDVAQVTYRDPGAERYRSLLRRQGGEWRVGLLSVPLRPPAS